MKPAGMLAISRRANQTIELDFGGQVAKVHVLQLRGNKVVLGIEGPPSIVVTRPDYTPQATPEAMLCPKH